MKRRFRLTRLAVAAFLGLLALQNLLFALCMSIMGIYDRISDACDSVLFNELDVTASEVRLILLSDSVRCKSSAQKISDMYSDYSDADITADACAEIAEMLEESGAGSAYIAFCTDDSTECDIVVLDAVYSHTSSEREAKILFGEGALTDGSGVSTAQDYHSEKYVLPDELANDLSSYYINNAEDFFTAPYTDNAIGKCAFTYSVPIYSMGNRTAVIGLNYYADNLVGTLDSGSEFVSPGSVISLGKSLGSNSVTAEYGYPLDINGLPFEFTTDTDYGNGHSVISASDGSMYSVYRVPLILRENVEWSLYGLSPYEIYDNTIVQLLIVQLVCSIVSAPFLILLVIAFCKRVTGGIDAVASSAKTLSAASKPEFPSSGILEIDNLSSSISSMGGKFENSRLKLSRVIKEMDICGAAFEIPDNGGDVYVSDNMGVFIDSFSDESDGVMSRAEWEKAFNDFTRNNKINEDGIYHVITGSSSEKWIKLVKFSTEYSSMGVFLDVSKTVSEQRKLAYEQDFDHLSNMMNRRYFVSTAEQILAEDYIKTAQLSLYNLPELAYINAEYGYSLGDRCLKTAAAEIIASINPISAAVARYRGNTFAVLQFGAEPAEEYNSIAEGILKRINQHPLDTGTGASIEINVVMASASYPAEEKNFAMLAALAERRLDNTEK